MARRRSESPTGVGILVTHHDRASKFGPSRATYGRVDKGTNDTYEAADVGGGPGRCMEGPRDPGGPSEGDVDAAPKVIDIGPDVHLGPR